MRGQVDRRLDLGHDLRLEQQLLQPAALDGVFLQQDDDVLREEGANLVEPARDAGHRPPFARRAGRPSVG